MIALLDARSDSLTVTWPAIDGAKRYILELNTGAGGDGFRELSSKLTQPQAKKKNLAPGSSYSFRVAPVLDDDKAGSWITHDEAFATLSNEEGEKAMEAPTTSIGGNQALAVQWKPAEGSSTTGYELQMRENRGGETWKTIAASLSGTEVKKKNLASKSGYQFRVRPVVDPPIPFSPPSEAAVARGLSEALRRRWFNTLDNGTLLRSGSSKPVPLEDALGGKEFVLFYVSAHWCPPCRKFTPMLANWYKTVARPFVEVVFLSADHDEDGFKSYFEASHPWMAIDYDDDTREQLMAALQVQGIPRLVVVNALTGNIVENNAVGKPLDLNQW
eukprot:CAMPEP_0201125098 /NCGR_PEP_ID=MMETSP0850-20130426/19149_1 /ASSEMBLY_ACC=CAM_ASM_000622 /TAXON_ID=183588 /ORGANISM="Pseudo-nitzschia fraudulenta, Strain WWA7" /LENGTH=329 /DNA_ID=CAMNT_0047392901 /DNA_START=117 /DNA_END=1103 /DNA_ORIENTATION=-